MINNLIKCTTDFFTVIKSCTPPLQLNRARIMDVIIVCDTFLVHLNRK